MSDLTERLCKLYEASEKSLLISALQECVEEGADVVQVVPGCSILRPLLSGFILRGHREAVLTCLETPRTIDYTAEDSVGGTPLHAIAEANTGSDAYNRDLVRAVVERIARCPADKVNWEQEDLKGRHFLSLAAENQLLSTIWPEVRHLPCYADTTRPLRLAGRVWQWDWQALGPEVQQRFEREDCIAADQNTGGFLKLVQRTPVDLQLLKKFVLSGADVMINAGLPASMDYPALIAYVDAEELDAVVACLQSPRPIDFTMTDYCGRTLMHAIALANVGSNEYNRDVLHAVVDRIARCPMDMVDWSQRDIMGRDFISLAAQNQLLSSVWPEVRDEVAYFADNTAGIPLTGEVWAWDWEALEEEDRIVLDRTKASRFLQADRPTGKLWKLVIQPEPCLDRMQACVAAQADVMFAHSDACLLLRFIEWGRTELAAVLLDTPRPIDFTMADKEGVTVLHAIARLSNSSRAGVRSLLHRVLTHVKAHPDDNIDWRCRDASGLEPISYAASLGTLGVWVQVLFREAALACFLSGRPGRSHLIPISYPVDMDDWNCLTAEERECFIICDTARKRSWPGHFNFW